MFYRDSTIARVLNFVFNVFYYNLKEKDRIRRKINSKKNKFLNMKSVLLLLLLLSLLLLLLLLLF